MMCCQRQNYSGVWIRAVCLQEDLGFKAREFSQLWLLHLQTRGCGALLRGQQPVSDLVFISAASSPFFFFFISFSCLLCYSPMLLLWLEFAGQGCPPAFLVLPLTSCKNFKAFKNIFLPVGREVPFFFLIFFVVFAGSKQPQLC